jgi:hypothetical protein
VLLTDIDAQGAEQFDTSKLIMDETGKLIGVIGDEVV